MQTEKIRYSFDGKNHRAVYKGIEYIKRPGRKYFLSYETLHRQIWKEVNGDIPEGKHIHHKDKDILNNEITNLECLSRKEHAQKHKAEHSERRRKWINKIRPLASKWHGSEEGRKWHSKHGKDTWKNRKWFKKVCIECGKDYLTMSNKKTDRFCSRLCISRCNERTKRYYETRKCLICGADFTIKSSKKQTVCSRKCNWVRRKQKQSSLQSGS